MKEEPQNADRKKSKNTPLVLVLVLIIIGLCGYIVFGKNQDRSQQSNDTGSTQPTVQAMDENQAEYVKPEEPIDRSKNITLPGWGGFTIPAGAKTVTQGFEFHNPEENYWYEDWISINGSQLEKLVVDSGTAVELDHYLKLAGVNGSVTTVKSYDANCFEITQNAEGAYTIAGIGGFEGTKDITVETDQGEEVVLTAECQSQCYYMTFGLYLTDGDELLYQSNLVAPGKYIQKMEMSRSLDAGTYDAYVVCQPYQADKETKTNQGVVKITLTVK